MKLAKDFRADARKSLDKNWGNAILVILLVVACTSLVSFIPVFGAIISVVLAGPIMVGELIYFTKLSRKEEAKIGDVFYQLVDNLGTNFLTYLLQTIFVCLWTLLFIIPGIVKSYAYAMTMYLRAKKPNLQAREAIDLSQKLMNGNKWRLFCLHCSFIGWILLCILSLGIGFIFLIPYMEASNVAFYEEIYNKAEVEEKAEVKDEISAEKPEAEIVIEEKDVVVKTDDDKTEEHETEINTTEVVTEEIEIDSTEDNNEENKE